MANKSNRIFLLEEAKVSSALLKSAYQQWLVC